MSELPIYLTYEFSTPFATFISWEIFINYITFTWRNTHLIGLATQDTIIPLHIISKLSCSDCTLIFFLLFVVLFVLSARLCPFWFLLCHFWQFHVSVRHSIFISGELRLLSTVFTFLLYFILHLFLFLLCNATSY